MQLYIRAVPYDYDSARIRQQNTVGYPVWPVSRLMALNRIWVALIPGKVDHVVLAVVHIAGRPWIHQHRPLSDGLSAIPIVLVVHSHSVVDSLKTQKCFLFFKQKFQVKFNLCFSLYFRDSLDVEE